MKLGNTIIGEQEHKVVLLDIAKLPSGTPIHIRVYVYRSGQPGSTVLAMGGLHGDEINGVEIVRRMIAGGTFSKIQKGNIIAIPLLNVYGFNHFSREVVEGKDVNRSFPGSVKGSLASRVAHVITNEILPLIDFGVDFHTGGSTRYNYPQIRYSAGDESAEILANQFAAPLLMEKKNIKGTFRHTAANQNKPILVYEGGESLRYDGLSIQHGIDGFKRVLKAHGILEGTEPILRQPIHLRRFNWIRAAKTGLFEWSKSSGQTVSKGEVIGVINSLHGENTVRVKANKDGVIVGHNNAAVVNAGDALFHIGV